MIPSNPDNNQPLIYRICDSEGAFHLVAPFDHTHAQSEVDGLPAELADKADATATQAALNGKANLVHTHTQSEIDGLQSALLNKADAGTTDIKLNEKIDKVPSATSGDIAVFDIDGAVEDSGIKVSDLQTKLTFDSTPTTESTNPVTSGGVKAALDEFINIDAQTTPLIPTSRFVTGKKYQIVVTNPVEKFVHQYFTKGEAASELINIIGNKLVTSQSDFGMLIWRDYESNRLHVIYQGEFEDQGLDD